MQPQRMRNVILEKSEPAIGRATTLKDIPMFGGQIPAGTEVLIVHKFKSGSGSDLVNIRCGFVECYGVMANSIAEKSADSPF